MKSICPDCTLMAKEIRRKSTLRQENIVWGLCVSYSTVNRLENDRAKPSPLAKKRIEELLRSMGPEQRSPWRA